MCCALRGLSLKRVKYICIHLHKTNKQEIRREGEWAMNFLREVTVPALTKENLTRFIKMCGRFCQTYYKIVLILNT
jgi:hypothetical protein